MTAFSEQAPSRHASYGQHWGEGIARCFSIATGDFLNEDQAVRLMPVPECFVCPISAGLMRDPVATVDGCAYEREHIERWFRERRQHAQEITSPITGLDLPSATLMPLVALQKAIEAYLAHRPELKRAHMAGRSFEEAATILQTDFIEKQVMHSSAQEEIKRLRQANRTLRRTLLQAQADAASASGLSLAALCDPVQEFPQPLSKEGRSAVPAAQVDANSTPITGGKIVCAPSSEVRRLRSKSETWRCFRRDMFFVFLLVAAMAGTYLLLLWRPSAASAAGARTVASGLDAAKLAASSVTPVDTTPGSRVAPHPQEAGGQRRFDAPDTAPTKPAKSGKLAGSGKLAEPIAQSLESLPFLSEVRQLWSSSTYERQRAARRLRELAADSAEHQGAIVRAGALSPLVSLLQDPSADLREEAARALWNLARTESDINGRHQLAIAQAGAIDVLVHLLEDVVPRVRVVAAAVLNDLAIDNPANQVAIARAGAIIPLIELFKNDDAASSVMASGLLQNLATQSADPQVAAALVGAVAPLVELLSSGSVLAQEEAALTLGMLAASGVELQAAIARAGAVEPLLGRLQGGMLEGTAAMVLRNLAAGQGSAEAGGQAGAVRPLVRLVEDGYPDLYGVREDALRGLAGLDRDIIHNQLLIFGEEGIVSLADMLKGDASGVLWSQGPKM